MKKTNILFKNKGLTNKERADFNLPSQLKDIIIGSCLGDLCITKQFKNAILRFRQGKIHEEYFNHLFELFKGFCAYEKPKVQDHYNKTTNKTYSSIYFNTNSLPCFNEFYDLFYLNGKKIVPKNIDELLTARSLAYWSQDDGSWVMGPKLNMDFT